MHIRSSSYIRAKFIFLQRQIFLIINSRKWQVELTKNIGFALHFGRTGKSTKHFRQYNPPDETEGREHNKIAEAYT